MIFVTWHVLDVDGRYLKIGLTEIGNEDVDWIRLS
jgi:hypothetical protein